MSYNNSNTANSYKTNGTAAAYTGQENDPYYSEQWSIFRTNSDKALELVNQKKEVKVAVVDTGVDYSHPDLKNRVDVELGYNFVDNNKDLMDDNWHGTHISGIIAAEANNNIGISGVVGPLDVKIIPVKVLDKNGKGPSDIIAKGIKYAVDKGADIINVSIGFKNEDPYIIDAINYARNKGVFVVAAAGNDNVNCDTLSPAGDKGVFTVSAIDQSDEKADFSNFGASIKLAAPGTSILSTVPGGDYQYRDGTSMAAPIVTGIAAMIKAEKPDITPDEMTNLLDSTATDILDKGKDEKTGYGIVNAYAAMLKLKESENNVKVLLK